MTDSPDTHRSALAERLREARKAAGMSQGQVAKVLQMHRPTVSEIEAGNRRVSAEELTRFAETYDVTVSWLLGETADQLEMNDPRLQLADSQACNCGSWHARYGLRQRHDEIIEALAEAGHPLSNDNGNLTLNALQELVDEAARLRAENERLKADARPYTVTCEPVIDRDWPEAHQVRIRNGGQRFDIGMHLETLEEAEHYVTMLRVALGIDAAT